MGDFDIFHPGIIKAAGNGSHLCGCKFVADGMTSVSQSGVYNVNE
jgi:hypothetical protein